MTNSTQFIAVAQRLINTKEVSRNWALSNYMSRLAAIIHSFRKQGVDFITKKVNGDFVYILENEKSKEILKTYVESKLEK